MKSRLVASIALGVAVVLGTTGCAMISTQATTIHYSAADGVNVSALGPPQVRNALVVANEDGSEGNFVAAIVNDTDQAETLHIEYGDPVQQATVRVPAHSVVSLGGDDEPLLLENLDAKPGSDIEMAFQSG